MITVHLVSEMIGSVLTHLFLLKLQMWLISQEHSGLIIHFKQGLHYLVTLVQLLWPGNPVFAFESSVFVHL